VKAWEAAITPKTRALYGETIGNPRGSILDLETFAALARAHRIPLIVDNTFATPYLCRPMEWGATIVNYSATKFIGGHGNAIAGAILDSGTFDFSRYPTIAAPSPSYHDLRFFDTFGHYGFLMKARAETVRDVGACVAPMNAFLLIQGLETLSLRMDRHVANALAVAKFLEGHERVAWVAYAGLPSHQDHALARKYLPLGPGAVFSFGLKGDGESVRADGKRFTFDDLPPGSYEIHIYGPAVREPNNPGAFQTPVVGRRRITIGEGKEAEVEMGPAEAVQNGGS